MSYDAVLFDFDGVLVDSEPVHWRSWAEILKPFGVELDWETYQRVAVGVTDRKLSGVFAGMAAPALDPKVLRERFPAKRQIFLREMLRTPSIPAELIRMLDAVVNVKLAVVTSSYRSEVEPLLVAAGIRARFDAVIDFDDVAEHKPLPAPYLEAARRLGAARPLVVEDSAAGVESARAAGFDVIRVSSPSEVASAVREALENGRAPR